MPKPTIMAHQWEQLASYNEYLGHDYIKPTLGYYDASSVDTMAWQLDLANNAGIKWFIFDTYLSPDTGEEWFDDSFKAYLASPNKNLIQFATMYTNAEGLVPLNPIKQLKQFEGYVRWNKKIIDEVDMVSFCFF